METTPNIEALIIEDEADICYLLSSILKKKNLHSTYVNSLRDAEKTLTKQNPAILFLDNHLPDGYGIDFINKIKQNKPYTKVIMITAHDTAADKERALHNGADYFIGKPFTKDTINATLDLVLKNVG